MTLYDIRARRIEVGDLIAWPNRRGASMWLNYGTVFYIGEIDGPDRSLPYVDVRIDGPRESNRLTRLTALSHIVVIG